MIQRAVNDKEIITQSSVTNSLSWKKSLLPPKCHEKEIASKGKGRFIY